MQGNFTEIRPFGPAILKFSLPQELVRNFNLSIDEIIDGRGEWNDHSEFLAGKVTSELSIPDKVLYSNADFICKSADDYMTHLNKRCSSINVDHHQKNIIGSQEKFTYTIDASWFVRSFANDYNPVHFHPGCSLSSIGYLKLPDWQEELAKDKEDHFGLTHGCVQFVYGTGGRPFENHLYTIRPKVGDFYVFPSWLSHTVYPFKSLGERRSFSVNISVEVLQG